MHRPYPDRDRALRHVRRARANYQYGRVPQRYVLGIDGIQALGETLRRAQPTGLQLATALAGHRQERRP